MTREQIESITKELNIDYQGLLDDRWSIKCVEDAVAKAVLSRQKLLLEKVGKPLRELHAMVKGECPSLLNEDSGGNARLDMEIDSALAIIEKEGGE